METFLEVLSMFQPQNGTKQSEGIDEIRRLYPSRPPISITLLLPNLTGRQHWDSESTRKLHG